MQLTQEQIEEFKKQIIQQIESGFSEEKKGPAIERVNSMNDEEFIDFLKKNKLLSSEYDETDKDSYEEAEKENQSESPFRLIVDGKIPSYLIDENKECIAVLEIKPISKAHTIIIPKKSVAESGKIPPSVFSLAKIISKKIESQFKPKKVLISPSYILGEMILNLLPVYSNESLDSPRKQISNEELESLKKILGKKQNTKVERIKKTRIKKIEESKMWFPRRIP
ncbi:MAG: HIT family protein [Candidatus Pacearchaeota archaeon]|nr:HIT family protein [Candidatus Pacearchaeota archaeon]